MAQHRSAVRIRAKFILKINQGPEVTDEELQALLEDMRKFIRKELEDCNINQ